MARHITLRVAQEVWMLHGTFRPTLLAAWVKGAA